MEHDCFSWELFSMKTNESDIECPPPSPQPPPPPCGHNVIKELQFIMYQFPSLLLFSSFHRDFSFLFVVFFLSFLTARSFTNEKGLTL